MDIRRNIKYLLMEEKRRMKILLPSLLCGGFLLVVFLMTSCSEAQFFGEVDSQPSIEQKFVLKDCKTVISKGGHIEEIISATDTVFHENKGLIEMKDIGVEFFEEGRFYGLINAHSALLYLDAVPSRGIARHDIAFYEDTTYKGENGTFFHTTALNWDSAHKKMVCNEPSELTIPSDGGFWEIKCEGFEAAQDRENSADRKWDFSRWDYNDMTAFFITGDEVAR